MNKDKYNLLFHKSRLNEVAFKQVNHCDNELIHMLDIAVAENRNEVLEEVAAELEKFTFAFGVDTVSSFTAFVRGMKE